MKILHVVRQFYPDIGGLENYVLNLAKEQVNNGNEVSVATLNRSFRTGETFAKYEKVFDINIIRIPYFGSQRYPFAFSILKHLKGFDIIHVHAIDFFADFLALTAFLHKKKLFITTHGGFFHTKKNEVLKKIYFNIITRCILNRYKAIIACSGNDFNTFSKISNNVVLIYNGVDVERYLHVPKKVIKGKIITIGRIDVHKDIDKLITILGKLKEKGIDAKLEIIGPDSKNLMVQMKLQAQKLNIQESIVFAGKLSDDELIEALSSAHLFVSASSYEGFGIAAVESLASGTPCVLSNIPSFIEIIGSNEFGEITNFNNVNETVKKIEHFLNMDDVDYENISQKARVYANNFNWKKVADSITGHYN